MTDDATSSYSQDAVNMKSRISLFEQRSPVESKPTSQKTVVTPKTSVALSSVNKTSPKQIPNKLSTETAKSGQLRVASGIGKSIAQNIMHSPQNDYCSSPKNPNGTNVDNIFGKTNPINVPIRTWNLKASNPPLLTKSTTTQTYLKPSLVNPKTGRKDEDLVKSNDGRFYRRLSLPPVLGGKPPKPANKPPTLSLYRFRNGKSSSGDNSSEDIYEDTIGIKATKTTTNFDFKSKLQQFPSTASDKRISGTSNDKQKDKNNFKYDDNLIYDEIGP